MASPAQRRALLIAALTFMLISGCMPYWTELYFKPMPPASAEPGSCVGPNTTVRMSIAGVTALMAVHIVHDVPEPFLAILVPSGLRVALADRTIGVRRSGGNEVAIPIEQIATLQRSLSAGRMEQREVYLKPDEPMIGAASDRGRYDGKWFRLTVRGPLEPSDVLTIRWPRLVVNGEVTALPEITFEKKRWHTVLMPINC
jgi:hypothetical protein